MVFVFSSWLFSSLFVFSYRIVMGALPEAIFLRTHLRLDQSRCPDQFQFLRFLFFIVRTLLPLCYLQRKFYSVLLAILSEFFGIRKMCPRWFSPFLDSLWVDIR